MCNHSLTSSKDCDYGHDYDLTTDEIYELRKNAAQTPCRYINRGESFEFRTDIHLQA